MAIQSHNAPEKLSALAHSRCDRLHQYQNKDKKSVA